jgi:hypothetical protein
MKWKILYKPYIISFLFLIHFIFVSIWIKIPLFYCRVWFFYYRIDLSNPNIFIMASRLLFENK